MLDYFIKICSTDNFHIMDQEKICYIIEIVKAEELANLKVVQDKIFENEIMKHFNLTMIASDTVFKKKYEVVICFIMVQKLLFIQL